MTTFTDVVFVPRELLVDLLIEADALATVFERLSGTSPFRLTEPLVESTCAVALEVFGDEFWLDAVSGPAHERANDLLGSFVRGGCDDA